MPFLRVISGPLDGHVFAVEDDGLSIGRADENTIALGDDAVSFLHARVLRKPSGYLLEDLNSRNGTFVNGVRVDAQPLHPGDRMQIGHTVLMFCLRADDPVEPDDDGHRQLTWTDTSESINQIIYEADAGFARGGEQSQVLVELARRLSRIDALQPLLESLMQLMCDTFKAERGFVMLFEERGGRVHRKLMALRQAAGGEASPVSRTLVDQVVRDGKPILSFDASADQRFSHVESIVGHGMHAVMCAPIQRGERILGVVHLDSGDDAGLFGRAELELLSTICNEAAVSIDGARSRAQLTRLMTEHEAVLATMDDALILLDGAGEVTRSTRLDLLGLGEDDLIGRRLADHPWLGPLAADGGDGARPRPLELRPPDRGPLSVEVRAGRVDEAVALRVRLS